MKDKRKGKRKALDHVSNAYKSLTKDQILKTKDLNRYFTKEEI